MKKIIMSIVVIATGLSLSSCSNSTNRSSQCHLDNSKGTVENMVDAGSQKNNLTTTSIIETTPDDNSKDITYISTTTKTLQSQETTLITTSEVTTTAIETTIAETSPYLNDEITTLTEELLPEKTLEFYSKNDMLELCCSLIAEHMNSAIEYYYYDDAQNITFDVIDESFYPYDSNFPYYVNGWDCYTENKYYFVPVYYYMGTNCGTLVVDTDRGILCYKEEYEAGYMDGVELQILFWNEGYNFLDEYDDIDVYVDSKYIGTAESEDVLDLSGDNCSYFTEKIIVKPGNHIVELKAHNSTALYHIQVDEYGAVFCFKASASDGEWTGGIEEDWYISTKIMDNDKICYYNDFSIPSEYNDDEKLEYVSYAKTDIMLSHLDDIMY